MSPAVPKPKAKRKPKPRFSSIVDRRTPQQKIAAAKRLRGTTPVKKTKRPAKERRAKFEREYGGPEYLAFIQSKPCCACPDFYPCEAAHTTTGGMGRKANAAWLVPLCKQWPVPDGLREGCHRELHRIGIKSFEAKHNVNLKEIAAKLYAEFQSTHQ